MIIAVDMEIRISLLQAVQAVFFFSLLIAVSAWDLRYRIIPDRFQAGIALLSFLNFAPGQLLGALGAVPYLIVALFCKREGGMGGGDIKLAGATGLVLGLPASLTASCLGLTGFVMYGCMVCLWNRFKGKRDKEAFPVGPFLAGGAAAVYCMRLGGWMILRRNYGSWFVLQCRLQWLRPSYTTTENRKTAVSGTLVKKESK